MAFGCGSFSFVWSVCQDEFLRLFVRGGYCAFNTRNIIQILVLHLFPNKLYRVLTSVV